MSSDNDIVLSVRNVSKCFEMYEKPVHRLFQTLCAGKRKFYKEFWALRDISFDVMAGECVGIIGRNGAGKSTLLQIITGTLSPTAGSVKISGRVAALLELGSGFNPEFTGRENIFLNGAILGLSKAEIDSHYDEILAFADIGDFINQPVKTYSSGMLVRLAFAVQAMCNPDVMIVDEALAVGDVFFQQKCIRKIKNLIAAGTTVLFVSHSMATVQSFCSRCIYLKHGSTVEIGPATKVCDRYLNDSTEEVMQESEVDAIGALQKPGAGLVKAEVWRFREDKDLLRRCSEVSGNENAVITALDFYDINGKRVSSCYPGDEIVAVASIMAKSDVPAGACAGLLCRDSNNVDLFGMNGNHYGVYLDAMKAGEKRTVEWHFSFPLLPSTYVFSIGLKPLAQSNVFYHRIFTAAVLEVYYPQCGIVNSGFVYMPKCRMVIGRNGDVNV